MPLVPELHPPEGASPDLGPLAPSPGAELVAVFESGDVYAFLATADALRRAGISFYGAEHYTGEFGTGKREQVPYIRTLLVEQWQEAEALTALATLAGET